MHRIFIQGVKLIGLVQIICLKHRVKYPVPWALETEAYKLRQLKDPGQGQY